jgi:hypothetical protein
MLADAGEAAQHRLCQSLQAHGGPPEYLVQRLLVARPHPVEQGQQQRGVQLGCHGRPPG